MFVLIPIFVLLIILTSFYVYSFFSDERRIKSFILKCLCAITFAIIGIIAIILKKEIHATQIIILIGLILCMFGDILLGLRRVTKFHDGFFLIGTFVFIFAHITYDAAFFLTFNENYILMIAITIFLWTSFLVITKYTKVDFRSFQIPCYIYMLSSAIMLAIAIVTLIKVQNLFNIIMLIGIFLFVCSDVLLCYTYFHKGIKESFLVKLISSYAYFLGQGLIAICILIS